MSQPRAAGALQGIALVLPVITIVMGSAILAPNFLLILSAFQQQVPGVTAEYLVNALLTIPALCIALFSPIAGMLADTIGRRKLLIVAMTIYGLVGTVPLFIVDVWWILASRVILGMVEAIIMTCSTTLIGDYYTGKQRDHWLAMQTTTASVSSIVMFPLGGFIGATYGWNYPFAMYVVSLLLVLLVVFFTWEPARVNGERKPYSSSMWKRILSLYVLGIGLTVVMTIALKSMLTGLGWVALYAMAIALLFALSIPVMAVFGRRQSIADRKSAFSVKRFPWQRFSGIMLVVALTSVMFYLLQIKLAQALSEMDLSQFLASDIDATLKFSLIIALTSIGIPLGTVVFSRVSQTPIAYLLLAQFVTIAIGFFGMGWSTNVFTMIGFSFINQFGCGLALPTMLTWTMRQLSFEQRGTGAGLFSGYMNGGQFVGPQLLTYLAVSFTAGAIKPAFAYIGWLAAILAVGALVAIVCRKGTEKIHHDGAPGSDSDAGETVIMH